MKKYFKVHITDKKTGDVITIQEGKDFMEILDKYGIKSKIGRNAFLPEYIKEYNKQYPNNIAEIKFDSETM